MRSTLARKICFAVLLVFLTSLAASTLSPGWLAHDLGHELEHLAGGDGVAAVHGLPVGESETTPDSDAEHRAMHAAMQYVPAPSPDFRWQSFPAMGVIRSVFAAPPVAHPTLEAPFRPPRTRSA